MRELPAGLTDKLKQSRRHTVDQIAKLQAAAHILCEFEILGQRWPSSAHQKIECEAFGEDVVLVELGRGNDLAPPLVASQRFAIEAVEQEETGVCRAQAGQE